MIECEDCLQWYHCMCERVSQEALANENGKWVCRKCQKKNHKQSIKK